MRLMAANSPSIIQMDVQPLRNAIATSLDTIPLSISMPMISTKIITIWIKYFTALLKYIIWSLTKNLFSGMW